MGMLLRGTQNQVSDFFKLYILYGGVWLFQKWDKKKGVHQELSMLWSIAALGSCLTAPNTKLEFGMAGVPIEPNNGAWPRALATGCGANVGTIASGVGAEYPNPNVTPAAVLIIGVLGILFPNTSLSNCCSCCATAAQQISSLISIESLQTSYSLGQSHKFSLNINNNNA